MPEFLTVCRASEIAEGQARMLIVNDRRLAVFHVGNDFFAIDDSCPHAGASLACGYVTGDTVACRIHHWRFCLRSGRYLDEDKPQYNVRSYRVRVLGGQLQVDLGGDQ